MSKAKAYAALAFGLVGEAVTLGLVPDRWQAVAGGFVALGVALGVYSVPNKVKPEAEPFKGFYDEANKPKA